MGGHGPRDRPRDGPLVLRLLPVGATAVCEAFGAPRVAWAVVEAVVVVAAFTALAIALRTRRASIGLRRPARRAVRDAIAGFGAIAIGGLIIVSILNGGLPGPTDGDPSAMQLVLSVIVGAFAIAIAEEVAFRSVLQHWLARTTGEWPAVAVQAIAYGVWVTAAGWGPLFGIAAGAAGLAAGAITVRTNSILTVLAWHAGIAVPLFAVLLCP
jgi:membrane protease YdiL (CAAX protease family)